MVFDALSKNILEQLRNNGPMKARELAKILKVEKRDINSRLYSSLRELCNRDEDFYWSIVKNNNAVAQIDFNEQEYYTIIENNDSKQLEQFLYSLSREVLRIPQILFVKPIISGYILSKQFMTILFEYIKRNGIDLNSNDFFLNRKDDLKGIDLVSGCLCFSIYYLQGKKMFLSQDEVMMFSYMIKSARKMGWETNNPLNNKNAQDIIFILLSKGHQELKPVYDALFEEIDLDVQTYTCCNQEKDVDDSTENDLNNLANSSTDTYSLDCFMSLLRSLAINGYIDESLLNVDNPVGLKIHSMQKALNYKSIEELIERFGFKIGVIEGNVEYDIFKESILEHGSYDEFLNTDIVGLSNRTYNCLTRFGVRTYNDLLNLNLEEFEVSKGVGNYVIKEVTDEIHKIYYYRKLDTILNNKD